MSDNNEFMSGICVALQHVTASDNGVLWREIVESVGVDEMLNYAARIEPDEWHLAGFDRYSFSELGRLKPRTRKPQTIAR